MVPVLVFSVGGIKWFGISLGLSFWQGQSVWNQSWFFSVGGLGGLASILASSVRGVKLRGLESVFFFLMVRKVVPVQAL